MESVDAQGLEALSSGSVPAVSDAVVAELGSTMAGLELECKGTGATAPSSKPAEASSILKLKGADCRRVQDAGSACASMAYPALTSPCECAGLPYSTSEREIRDFFAGYEVKGIRFVFEPDGRPSGLVSTWAPPACHSLTPRVLLCPITNLAHPLLAPHARRLSPNLAAGMKL